MTFLLDVHLPRLLGEFIRSKGSDAVHGLDILNKGRTKDKDIRLHADMNQYIVVTKDKDFVASHVALGSPKKLIKINLGNLSNQELLRIFDKNWKLLLECSESAHFMLEIDRTALVMHDRKSEQPPT